MATWADALPEEDKTYLASKGWDKFETPDKAVGTILGSYRAAESKIGAPPGDFVKWATSATEVPAEVFKRLGVPEAADAYKFEGVDEELQATLRAVAHANKLTPAQAQAVAAGLTTAGKAKGEAAQAAATVAAQAEEIKLRAAWGGEYDVQKAITDRFLEKLPLSPAQKEAFTGSAAGNQLLYAIAHADREAGTKGIGGGSDASGTGKMSPEEAAATLENRKGDREWVKKWQSGDKAAIDEFNNLTTLMVTRRA